MSAIDVMHPLFEWTSVRWNKCEVLYRLAKEATGPIVELGAYTGNGTIALGLGSRDGHNVPVYGIDQWQQFTGLYRQQFYPEDKLQFIKNCRTVGVAVHPIQGDVEEEGKHWPYGPVALVIWDVSLPRLYSDWIAWHNNVVPGGLFVAKDTTIWDFGWRKVLKSALDMGWTGALDEPDACLWGVRKLE
jgi:hypothetical protein